MNVVDARNDKLAAAAANRLMTKIVVELGEDDGPIHEKAFEGVWLVRESEPDAEEERSWSNGAAWSVALTKGLRLVVYVTNAKERGGEMKIYEGFDELRGSGETPEKLVAEVAVELGVDHVFELDI